MLHIHAILKGFIVTGFFIFVEFVAISDSGATVYTCLDRTGKAIFTDSSTQLHNCKVLSFPLSTSNTEKKDAQEPSSSERTQGENVEPVSAHIPPHLALNRIAENESMPTPPALHDHQTPPSTPFSNLSTGDLPPGFAELLESGNMPTLEIFNEGTLPQGLPFDNGVSPYVESQNNLTGTEIQQPGFFIPPDIEAPTLSEIPYSIFSNQSAGPGSE